MADPTFCYALITKPSGHQKRCKVICHTASWCYPFCGDHITNFDNIERADQHLVIIAKDDQQWLTQARQTLATHHDRYHKLFPKKKTPT